MEDILRNNTGDPLKFTYEEVDMLLTITVNVLNHFWSDENYEIYKSLKAKMYQAYCKANELKHKELKDNHYGQETNKS